MDKVLKDNHIVFVVLLLPNGVPSYPQGSLAELFPCAQQSLVQLLREDRRLQVHKSVLSKYSLFHALKTKADNSSDSDSVSDSDSEFESKSDRVLRLHRTPLLSFCAVVWYLYTGEIKLEQDLKNFRITYDRCGKTRTNLDLEELESRANPGSKTGPKSTVGAANANELFALATEYKILEIRNHCRELILSMGTKESVLVAIFSDATKGDLSLENVEMMAQQLVDYYDTIVSESADVDPFEPFKSHPQF
ncbi:hypothetical protein BG004_001186 [Podila humilis]|nr:hypothetical protein BG004_001186 [Podila humilis]